MNGSPAQPVTPKPTTKSRWFYILIALVVLAALAVWYWQSRRAPEAPATEAPAAAPSPAAETGLGATLYQGVSPAEKLPETNPFSETRNPLDGVYQNPFGQ